MPRSRYDPIRMRKEAEGLAGEFLEIRPDPPPSTKTFKLIQEFMKSRIVSPYQQEVFAKMVWEVLFPGRDLPQEAYPQSLF